MSGRFADSVVVVTGATSGIGWDTALAFAAEGATVIGGGRDQKRLADLEEYVELALTMDVTSDSSVETAAAAIQDRFGRVDVLINNAGIGLFENWRDTPVSEMNRVMDTNLYGAVRITRALLPGMLERRQGVVVNVASVAGKRGYAKHTAYCASKHALIGWSESLRLDLVGTGVDVVVACPPAVKTPFFENAGYMTFDEDHKGLELMTSAEVADHLVEATFRRERQRIMGTRAKILYAISLVAPDGLDRIRRITGKVKTQG